MTTASKIPVHADRVNPGFEELCFSGWSCQLSALLSDVWIVLVVGIAVGLLVGTLVYLKSARTDLTEEQSRTAAEREAFLEFANRVADLSAESRPKMSRASTGGAVAMATTGPSANALAEVNAAYRETVMAVPHYEEEYAEPLAEHMATEFGPEVATSVSTARDLSTMLQRTLVSKARASAKERERLMQTLSREEDSIIEAEETFDEIHSGLTAFHPRKLEDCAFSTLQNRWEELENYERRSTDALSARQETIRTHPFGGLESNDGLPFFEYLYHSVDVNYPVLATGTEILEQIQTSKSTIARIASMKP